MSNEWEITDRIKYTISDRILELIEHTTSAHRKFTQFEELTGIKRQTWQNLANKKQRANEDMLETIGNRWPQYSYWIMTGETDGKRHTSPIIEKIELYEKQRHCIPGIKKIENQEELLAEMEKNTIPRLKKSDTLPIKSKK
jgi:hypothetical protein